MSLDRYKGLINNIGKKGAHALFPEDFEVYITAFELVDSKGKIIDYFIFPLNPTSISETTSELVNIKKTAGGITVLGTDTFHPVDINIKGNFGRKFKVLFRNNNVSFLGFNSRAGLLKKEFSSNVKTGYGCIKILENIIKTSRKLDQYDKPYSLYFYNLNFGTSYLVKSIGNPTFSQNIEKNMIWEYAITLKAIAPLDQLLQNAGSTFKLLASDAIQGELNVFANSIKQLI